MIPMPSSPRNSRQKTIEMTILETDLTIEEEIGHVTGEETEMIKIVETGHVIEVDHVTETGHVIEIGHMTETGDETGREIETEVIDHEAIDTDRAIEIGEHAIGTIDEDTTTARKVHNGRRML